MLRAVGQSPVAPAAVLTRQLWLNAVVTLGGMILMISLPSKMADQREGG